MSLCYNSGILIALSGGTAGCEAGIKAASAGEVRHMVKHPQAAILIVEDEESSREVLRARLRLSGYRNVSAAASGPEALDSVAQHIPDLILLDVRMPGMDGYEVTRRIRAAYPHVFLPIVLISVLQKSEDRVAGIEAGANDFICKPFNLNEVVARVESLLALKQARDELAAERDETRRMLTALTRYMSPALVERVFNDPDILTRRERRQALVLFADLRGFTRLTAEHSPDAVIDLLNDVFTEMMEIVYQYEGVIFDIAGDELLIGFNVPYSQPDAHHRALTTAVAMQRRFAQLKARWFEKGMPVGMGIGINAGPVILGHVGGRARMSYAMVGETVNIAHRLVEIAADGQIVVSPEVLSGGLPDEDSLIVRELPPYPLEGVEEPRPVTVLELA